MPSIKFFPIFATGTDVFRQKQEPGKKKIFLDYQNTFGSGLLLGTSLGNLLGGLDGPWWVRMIAQLISMGM